MSPSTIRTGPPRSCHYTRIRFTSWGTATGYHARASLQREGINQYVYNAYLLSLLAHACASHCNIITTHAIATRATSMRDHCDARIYTRGGFSSLDTHRYWAACGTRSGRSRAVQLSAVRKVSSTGECSRVAPAQDPRRYHRCDPL